MNQGDLICDLKDELFKQWAFNHDSRCKCETPGDRRDPSHTGRCGWPRPEILDTFAEVDGYIESFGSPAHK